MGRKTTVVTTCDRCGAEIQKGAARYMVEYTVPAMNKETGEEYDGLVSILIQNLLCMSCGVTAGLDKMCGPSYPAPVEEGGL